jgi:hypothetical protein
MTIFKKQREYLIILREKVEVVDNYIQKLNRKDYSIGNGRDDTPGTT